MRDTDLAWLAGIWEGEGSILLFSRPVTESRIQITPTCQVSNTDAHLMNKVRKILEEIDCYFSWRQYRPKKGTKDCYRLSSTNAHTMKKFLTAVVPFMYGEKKALGETLLAFVSRRVEKASTQKGGLKHTPYDAEDFEFLRSSETLRRAPLGEDKVQPLT